MTEHAEQEYGALVAEPRERERLGWLGWAALAGGTAPALFAVCYAIGFPSLGDLPGFGSPAESEPIVHHLALHDRAAAPAAHVAAPHRAPVDRRRTRRPAPTTRPTTAAKRPSARPATPSGRPPAHDPIAAPPAPTPPTARAPAPGPAATPTVDPSPTEALPASPNLPTLPTIPPPPPPPGLGA